MPAGVWVDRWDRGKVLIWSQTTQAVTVAAIGADESTLHRWRSGESEPRSVFRSRMDALHEFQQELLDLAQKSARAMAFDWYIQQDVNFWSPEQEALYGLQPGSFDLVAMMDVIEHYDPDFIYTDGNSTQPFTGLKRLSCATRPRTS